MKSLAWIIADMPMPSSLNNRLSDRWFTWWTQRMRMLTRCGDYLVWGRPSFL